MPLQEPPPFSQASSTRLQCFPTHSPLKALLWLQGKRAAALQESSTPAFATSVPISWGHERKPLLQKCFSQKDAHASCPHPNPSHGVFSGAL